MGNKYIYIPVFDNRIDINEPDKIRAYEFKCNDDKCLRYMYDNGKTIYDETEKFVNTSDNIYSKKIKMLFNTENSIKNKLLNDLTIGHIQSEVSTSTNNNIDKNYVINHILYIIKPYLLNEKDIDSDTIIQDIINTMVFKPSYMGDIKNN